jgi:dihydrodipicolinate synthase/N-acetylneuraminate lyase
MQADRRLSSSYHDDVGIPPLRPGRRIEGISALLLPFTEDDRPDWQGFNVLIERTWAAGLTPAVNMDTGYVNLLSDAERRTVLEETKAAARGRPFVAGAFIEGRDDDPVRAYRNEIEGIRAAGGTPILFQCTRLATSTEADVLAAYAGVAAGGGSLIAFELGSMFAPFGRIYSEDFFRRLLDLEPFTGLKHSSLNREAEWRRLELRDRHRPGFRLYTGNDLAIDMVFYGSDYLLGLSAFAVDAFAARDRLWAAGDGRAIQVNDLLQYLGHVAFRAPVPAYKHSAAQFLRLGGHIATDRPHPRSPRRPDSDLALLEDIHQRLDAAIAQL